MLNLSEIYPQVAVVVTVKQMNKCIQNLIILKDVDIIIMYSYYYSMYDSYYDVSIVGSFDLLVCMFFAFPVQI